MVNIILIARVDNIQNIILKQKVLHQALVQALDLVQVQVQVQEDLNSQEHHPHQVPPMKIMKNGMKKKTGIMKKTRIMKKTMTMIMITNGTLPLPGMNSVLQKEKIVNV